MRLRDALDLCSDTQADDWIAVPGGRPATSMLAGLFDPGADEPRMRPLEGDRIAVYAPDVRLSLVWPVPDEDECHRPNRFERHIPEWAERDSHEWDHASPGTCVVLLSGSPIWQQRIWYLDWGTGIGGFVADFRPRFGPGVAEGGTRRLEGWDASAWAIGLARLLNVFSATGEFDAFEPTSRVVPSPSTLHPVDAARVALR